MPILVMLLVHPDSRIASSGLFLPKRLIDQEPTTHLRSGDICLTWAQRAMDGPGQFLRFPAKNVQFYTDTDWLAGNDSRQPPPAID
jgi:hypothetical protein